MLEVASGGVSCDQPALCGTATSDEANTVTATIARLDVGATVVVTYTAVVSELVEPGDQILDSGGADVDYTVGSALSAETPDVSTASANGDDSVLNEVLDPSVAIAIGRTSVSHSVGGEVVVEEFVSVRCSVSVPEVTTGLSLAFTLTLGANLEASGVTASLNTSAPVVLVGTGGPSTVGDTTTLDLGTASNADGNGEATVVVEFKFFVTSPAGAGTDIRGETVGVACTLTYTGGTADAPDDVNLVVAEPTLEHTLTATSATTELDAGDEVTFTLVVQHVSGTSDAPAYDVATTIVFEDGIEVVDGSWACTVDACGRFGASVDNGVREFTVTNDRLDESDVLTVTFTAVMAPASAVRPGAQYVISAHSAYDSSPKDSGPYTGRDYDVAVDSGVTLETSLGSFDAFVHVGDSKAQTVHPLTALDESVSYELTFLLPSGRSDVTLTVDWPVPGFVAVSSGVVSVGSAVSTTGLGEGGAASAVGLAQLLFDFGTVTVTANAAESDRRVTVNATLATPADEASLVEGDVLVVTSTLTTDAYTFGQETNVTLVETNMTIGHSVTQAPGVVDALDEFMFQSTVSHLGDSEAPGYDIEVYKAIDPLLSFTTFTCVPAVCSEVSRSGNELTLTVAEVPLGTDVVIDWTATVNQAVRPDDVISDEGVTELRFFTSDVFAGQRGYDVVHYSHAGTQLSTVAQASVSDISLLSSTIPESLNPELLVHEGVHFLLSWVLREFTSSPVFTVTVSPSNQFVNASVSVVSSSNVAAASGSLTVASNPGAFTISGATFSNIADNDESDTSSDTLVLDFAVTLDDDEIDVMRGNVFTFTLDVADEQSTSTASTPVVLTVVEPTLEHTLTATSATMELDAGDEVTFTLVVQHVSGTSDAPAYDVATTIVFEDGIEVVDGSWACTVDACGRFGASVDNE